MLFRSVYKCLQSCRPSPWQAFLSRKVGTWLMADHPYNWEWSQQLEDSLRTMLGKAGLRCATAVHKSWANAWTTSSRMDEDVCLPCIFGCNDEDDELSHYLCCDTLWTAAISNVSPRVELLRCSPYQRLCLSQPSLENARLLALVFSCYHAIKLAHRDLVDKCVADKDFLDVQVKLMALALAFKKDMTG